MKLRKKHSREYSFQEDPITLQSKLVENIVKIVKFNISEIDGSFGESDKDVEQILQTTSLNYLISCSKTCQYHMVVMPR